MMEDGNDDTQVSSQVTKYSILVGFVLIIVFVVPCVMFALLAKLFQSPDPDRRKRSTIRSLVGSIRLSMDNKEEGLHRVNSTSAKKLLDSDSSGYGTIGLVEIQPEALDTIEKIVTFKTKLACIETWKCYAPMTMNGSHNNKKMITIRKIGALAYSTSDREHNACLHAELDSLSEIPSHHLMLNLLGVCVSGSNGVPHAIMMEYPTYGSLYSFLICKRRGKVFGNTSLWGGLQLELSLDKLVFALSEDSRESLCHLLDDPSVRGRPFNQPLKDPLGTVDQLLMALQIAHGMQFLTDNGILHKRLSTENVVISHGFYLKLTGVDFDLPSIHQTTGPANRTQLKRTASGRNLLKWDAPEVIESSEFSEKSEIWRFGMTMWEIASLGDAPFADLPNRIMTELVKKGDKPSLPDKCSQQMYSLMELCWTLDRQQRPEFSEMIKRLNDEIQTYESTDMDRTCDNSSTPSTPQTASTILSPSPTTTYWTPPSTLEYKNGRGGSLRRPHPCSIPGQLAYKRLGHSSSIDIVSPSLEERFLEEEEDTETKTEVKVQAEVAVGDDYVETDV